MPKRSLDMLPYSTDKTVLRRTLLEKRNGLSLEERHLWDAAIAVQLHVLLRQKQVKTLGVYWPIRSEPDLRSLYAELAREGMQLALPVVTAKDTPLHFAAWTPGEPLVKDAMSVLVPANTDRVIHPEALLIPCVGFNADKVRLGYGGGFYDRTLAATPRPYTFGVAYSCAKADFKGAPHDVPLDIVVTETCTIRPW